MLQLLRDPIWQFILGAGAIIVSWMLYRFQLNLREITYEVTHEAAISVPDIFRDEVKIMYAEQIVEDLSLLFVKLTNTGNSSILPDEFKRPIHLNFGQKAQILLCDAWGKPTSIKPLVMVSASEPSTVELSPLLLNTSDTVMIGVLLTGYQNDVIIEGRIVGVKDIQPKKDDANMNSTLIILVFSTLLALTGLARAGWDFFNVSADLRLYVFLIVLISGMYCFDAYYKIKYYYYQNQVDALGFAVVSFVVFILSLLLSRFILN